MSLETRRSEKPAASQLQSAILDMGSKLPKINP